jgi:hypothetical protein
VGNLVAKAAQGTGKDVMGHVCPEISDMGVVINRRSAAIKTGAAFFPGLKGL